MIYTLRRKTKNYVTKTARIFKDTIDEYQVLGIYSSFDDEPFYFCGYSVEQAIKRYEKETAYQNYCEIMYHTDEDEIKEQLEKLPPF